jgi:hypothetical protein
MNWKEILRNELIPENDRQIRNGRSKDPSEVYLRLFNSDPHKPGELAELYEALADAYSPTDVLSEIADLAYYGEELGSKAFERDFEKLSKQLGIPVQTALEAAVIKYGHRAKMGKDKQAENQAISSLAPKEINYNDGLKTLQGMLNAKQMYKP